MLRQFRLTAVLAAALASAACGIKGPLVLPPAPAPAPAPPGASATLPAAPAAPGPATGSPTLPERKP
jgi:predicted small lipoprotein YifL